MPPDRSERVALVRAAIIATCVVLGAFLVADASAPALLRLTEAGVQTRADAELYDRYTSLAQRDIRGIAFIGSSITREGIAAACIEERLGIPTHNLGVTGDWVERRVFETPLIRAAQFDTLVIEVGYATLSSRAHPASDRIMQSIRLVETDALETAITDPWVRETLTEAGRPIPEFTIAARVRQDRAVAHLALEAGLTTAAHSVRGSAPQPRTSSMADCATPGFGTPEIVIRGDHEITKDGWEAQMLLRMVDRLEGLRMIALVPAVAPRAASMVEPQSVEALDHELALLRERGVEIVDLRGTMEDELFRDAWHATARGREHMTAVLADAIARGRA